MVKLTKRKGFNFFRSYYDVYNELSDKDKVAFMDALLDRQFLGTKPTGLKGMSSFAYISQTNSIDSQVKGYEDKTGNKLTPRQGGADTPTGQVEGEVQVEEKGKVQGKGEVKPVEEKSTAGKTDYLDQVISLWCEKFNKVRGFEYEITAKGKERQAAGKIININKKMFAGQNSAEALESIGNLFEMCLNINDQWLSDNMSMPIIVSKFNVIKIKLNGQTKSKGSGGVTDQALADIISDHFKKQRDSL